MRSIPLSTSMQPKSFLKPPRIIALPHLEEVGDYPANVGSPFDLLEQWFRKYVTFPEGLGTLAEKRPECHSQIRRISVELEHTLFTTLFFNSQTKRSSSCHMEISVISWLIDGLSADSYGPTRFG
jgi:hypothetical protein